MSAWQRLNPECEDTATPLCHYLYSPILLLRSSDTYRFFNDSDTQRYVWHTASALEWRAFRALATGTARADMFRILFLKYNGGGIR